MNVFDLVGGLLSAAILVMIAERLIVGHGEVPKLARLGAGIFGAAIILTMAERLFPGSPFRDWAFVLLRIGAFVFLLSLYCGLRTSPPPR